MPDDLIVDVALLEEVFALLIARLRTGAGDNVAVDRDYYWSIPHGERYGVEAKPTDLTIGQVSECVEWLVSLRKTPDLALPYHLAVLGDVLRVLGDRLNPDFTSPADGA